MIEHEFNDDWCAKCGASRVAVEDNYISRHCADTNLARQIKDYHSRTMLNAERDWTDAVINAIGEVSVAEAQRAIQAWRREHGT